MGGAQRSGLRRHDGRGRHLRGMKARAARPHAKVQRRHDGRGRHWRGMKARTAQRDATRRDASVLAIAIDVPFATLFL
jgi:hypothetical protein